MITKFKIFENANKPELGDYVVVTYRNDFIPEIGKIEHINQEFVFPYLIFFNRKFNYYDYGLDDKNLVVTNDEIIYYSKNKNDAKKFLELKIKEDKYNL
jgi:hypothetical protein